MSIVTEPLTDFSLRTWFSEDLREGFNDRLVRQISESSENSAYRDIERCLLGRARSQQTSTIVHVHSEDDLDSMASDNVPGLSRRSTSSTISSDSDSIATTSAFDGGYVLETEDGVLTLPARHHPGADLFCPFQTLECRERFSDIVEFKIHVFSHFRGHPLPTFAPCFVCERPFFQRPDDDNALAWNNMLGHMVYEHYRDGVEEFRLKPDIAVMRYIWNRGVITDADFKRVQLEVAETQRPRTSNNERSRFGQVPEAPMPPAAFQSTEIPAEIRQYRIQSVGSSMEPYTTTAGRRQDRRQTSRLSLMARVRG